MLVRIVLGRQFDKTPFISCHWLCCRIYPDLLIQQFHFPLFVAIFSLLLIRQKQPEIRQGSSAVVMTVSTRITDSCGKN